MTPEILAEIERLERSYPYKIRLKIR